MWEGCLEGVSRLFGVCGKAVEKVCGGCLECRVWLYGGCVKMV